MILGDAPRGRKTVMSKSFTLDMSDTKACSMIKDDHA